MNGLTATNAYLAAYPRSGYEAARRSASDLLTRTDVQNEIARIRATAALLPGSAVLTLAEKRNALASFVRAANGMSESGDIVKTRDKLAAIALDNDLAGEGSEAKGNAGIAGLLTKLRK